VDKEKRATEITDGTSYNTELYKDEHDRPNKQKKFLCAFWASQQSIVGENLEVCNADTSLLGIPSVLTWTRQWLPPGTASDRLTVGGRPVGLRAVNPSQKAWMRAHRNAKTSIGG